MHIITYIRNLHIGVFQDNPICFGVFLFVLFLKSETISVVLHTRNNAAQGNFISLKLLLQTTHKHL